MTHEIYTEFKVRNKACWPLLSP